MRVWRLCAARSARAPLDGEGARRFGGRWNHPGTSLVYTSATLSLAALEVLVHFDPDTAPRGHVALEIEVPSTIRVETLDVRSLPRGWRRFPGPRRLRDLGAAWAAGGASAVLSVPSAIVAGERNFLINPAHPAARRIAVRRRLPFRFDPRLA